MLLFNQVLLAHALNRVVFAILFILAEHDLSKGPSPKHFQQLELFERVDFICIAFVFKDKLALSLHLLVLFHGLGVKVEWFNRMLFLLVVVHVDFSCRVLLQREIVIVV